MTDVTTLGKKIPIAFNKGHEIWSCTEGSFVLYRAFKNCNVIQRNTSTEILSLWCQKDRAEQLWIHLLPAFPRPHGGSVCLENSTTYLVQQGLGRGATWEPGCHQPMCDSEPLQRGRLHETKLEIQIKEGEIEKKKPALDKLFFFLSTPH